MMLRRCLDVTLRYFSGALLFDVTFLRQLQGGVTFRFLLTQKAIFSLYLLAVKLPNTLVSVRVACMLQTRQLPNNCIKLACNYT